MLIMSKDEGVDGCVGCETARAVGGMLRIMHRNLCK